MMPRVLLALGLAMLVAIWLGPLPSLAERYFAAHMVMHMGVVAIVAPILAAGLAVGGADPTVRLPHLFNAIPAALLELAVVWAWHTPGLHHAARTTVLGLVCEQGLFFAASLFLWMSVLGGGSRQRHRLTAGVTALLLTSAHMTLLGALLALAPRVLYAHEASVLPADVRLDDQHLGGAIMLVAGGLSYLAGGLWLVARGLHERTHERAVPAPWSRA